GAATFEEMPFVLFGSFALLSGEDKPKPEIKVDLDTILINEVGQFGRFQLRTLALTAIGVIFAAFHAEYVFTTARINTRCLIPECEDASETLFSPPWIASAVPTAGGSLDECRRFGNASSAATTTDDCPASLFDPSIILSCEQYVYENTQTVFDLACDEWRRSLIGFVRTFGTFAALPLTGYVSDRWGRRTALAINSFNTAWLGITRYWVGTYAGFMASEVIEAVFGSGVFSCTYILVLELVGPKYRVVAGGVLSSCFAIGQVIMGLIAWAVPDWRPLTLALYIPQLITIGYFWVISESVRWYMSKGRYEESEALLKEVARVNRKQLSEKSLQLLRVTTENEKKRKALEEVEKANEPWLIVLVFKHKLILLRCIILPIWWITMTLVYYGLSINAVNMSGNPYVNYIAVSAVEIPGFWISVLLLSRVGRKPVLMGGFWICAACQIAYIFLPDGKGSDLMLFVLFWALCFIGVTVCYSVLGIYGVSLTVYLIGKCSISAVTTAIYVYTAELYPTKYRHNLFAFSSMVGRIGSITAPLTPAITLGTKLPDTMEEAENIGRTKEFSHRR
ncbi:Organic cation transporter, partial [Operophtera brumata]